MSDELNELLDIAMYKEIASQALYLAAHEKTQDPGAQAMLKELAAQELNHSKMVRKLKDEKLYEKGWRREGVPNIKISEFLAGADIAEGANLQEVLIFAMKREQQSVEFYSNMMSAVFAESAKRLCQSLVNEELNHKLKIELQYDKLFYQEN